jgi:hypothetical protein
VEEAKPLLNFTVALVGDAVLDPDDARTCAAGHILSSTVAMQCGAGRAVQLFGWKSEVGVIAYRRQDKARFGLPSLHTKQPSCQTRPDQIDPLYPPHLRGLPRVWGNRKKGNFPPATGFDLV